MIADECSPFRAQSVDASTVAVGGDVDAYSAPDLAAALLSPGVSRIVLTDVTFIDAAGLAALLAAHRSRPHGLTLCSPSPCVLRLLDLTWHCSTFHITYQ